MVCILTLTRFDVVLIIFGTVIVVVFLLFFCPRENIFITLLPEKYWIVKLNFLFHKKNLYQLRQLVGLQ